MKRKLLLLLALIILGGLNHAVAQGCTGFKTFTIGGWGTNCQGDNPGCYRDANFAAAFPSGITLGCGANTLTLTSSSAVQAFLPSGTTPTSLPNGSMTDPGSSYQNVFAGQLLGVMLAVGFDSNDPNFGTATASLGGLSIVSGPFAGKTVNEFIALANAAIGGCDSTYSFGDLNAAASAINENFDNSTVDNGYLNCQVFSFSLALVDNVHCFGEATGQERINVSGGMAPYTVTLSNGMVVISSSTSVLITGLSAGSYTVTVTDSNGNVAEGSNSFSISQPVSALAISVSHSDATCYGGNGEATATVSGGVGPYSYSWNTNPAQTNATALLPVGSWSVTATDANGCVISSSVSIVLLTCNGFKTVTQGGYSAVCKGNNNGCYLNSRFASSFPAGLTIGTASRFLKFTSAAAVRNFLPSGTTARALTSSMTNPTAAQYKNILAGQALTLTLNIKFDADDAAFSASNTALGSLIVNSGVFAGNSVNQMLAYANVILGGGTTSPAYSATQVNDAIDMINNNYDNGHNLGYLSCPCVSGRMGDDSSGDSFATDFVVYPNPIKQQSTIGYSVSVDSPVALSIYNIMGQMVKTFYKGQAKAGEKYSLEINVGDLDSGVYFIKLNTDQKVFTKSVIISN